MSTVAAIYENGVFRPLEKVELPESARVQLTVSDAPDPDETEPDPYASVRAILAWRYDGEPDDAARVDPARKQ